MTLPPCQPYLRLAEGAVVSPDFKMKIPERKTLPHAIPSWVDPQKEIYFITINCVERGRNQLALPAVSESLFETSVTGRKDFCGGRICSCSCPTMCTR
jgi:hypothetical protein